MSVIKQALSDAVVPVAHTRLNNYDAPDRTATEHLTDSFFLEFPGYRSASVNSGIFLGMATQSNLDERIWAHELVVHCRSGFPSQSQEFPEGEVGGMTSNLLIAMQGMTRERAERFIAPLFIYSRSHIETEYTAGINGIPHDKPIINLDTIDPEVHNLKTEFLRHGTDLYWKAIQKFMTRLYVAKLSEYNAFGKSLHITSSGVFLSGTEDFQWVQFDAANHMQPADPYGPNAPSARAVVGALLRELRSQSDVALAGIIVKLLTGVRTHAYQSKHDGQPYKMNHFGRNLLEEIESWKRPEPGIFKAA